MSRNVELPDDVYARIEAEASATGATVAEWIAAHAPNGCPPAHTNGGADSDAASQDLAEAPVETRTLADRLAGRIGRLRSDRGDLSERGSELFAEALLAQQKAGRQNVELPDDVYARIEETASASGISVAEVIASRTPALAPPLVNSNGQPRSMADVLAGRLGTIASGGLEAIAARPGDAFRIT
jgi:hypothetical protein